MRKRHVFETLLASLVQHSNVWRKYRQGTNSKEFDGIAVANCVDLSIPRVPCPCVAGSNPFASASSGTGTPAGGLFGAPPTPQLSHVAVQVV